MAPPPGPCPDAAWTPDRTLFHNPTPPAPCIPVNAMLFVFVEIALVSALLVAAAARRLRSAKADAQKLLKTVIVSQVLVAGTSLSLWLQAGLFEGAALCALAFIVSTSQVGRLLLNLALNPAVSLGVKKEQLAMIMRFYNVFTLMMLIALSALFFVLTWATRLDDFTYNRIGVSIVFVLAFYATVLAGGVLYHLIQLERAIAAITMNAPRLRQSQNSGLPSNKLDAFNAKIKRLNSHVAIFLLATAPVLFSVAVTFLILGYFPYVFIVMTVLLNAISFVTFVILHLLSSRRYLAGTESRNNSKIALPQGSSSAHSVANGVAVSASLEGGQ